MQELPNSNPCKILESPLEGLFFFPTRHIQEELNSIFTEEEIKQMDLEELAFNWF